jgi:RNA polymerase sigma-70 factor (TIGR02957 family)
VTAEGDVVSRTEEFEELRPLLFSLSYRLLGSVAEAEDTVQEAWLRYETTPTRPRSPRAFLSAVVTRISIDVLRSARVRREEYVGEWLPEPLLTDPYEDPARSAELADSLSMAALLLLERLSPLERAVFVLREVFGMSVAEVAGALNRSEAAVRQMAHRAREHVHARQPRFDTDPQEQRQVTERFLAAAVSGDVESLLAAMAPGVVLIADGGGKVTAARRPIVGADKVARFLAAVGPQGVDLPGLRVEVAGINGAPAVVAWTDEGPFMALQLVLVDGLVEQILFMGNPDKLAGLAPSG